MTESNEDPLSIEIKKEIKEENISTEYDIEKIGNIIEILIFCF